MSLATSSSVRALALAAVLAAAAAPAFAASVKVNVAGLDAQTTHNRITQAAQTACSAALVDQPMRFYAMASCIDETVAATEAKFAANEHRYASVQNGR